MTVRRPLGLSREVIAVRGGMTWRLDLQEGIDLSIYLLGAFERSTTRLYRRLVKPGDIVLDIGANIGAHTLPLATLVGDQGKVFAFEPTGFAFAKLRTNLELNPALISRVVTRQVMLVAAAGRSLDPSIYSSWPLGPSEGLHEKHRGRLMDTGGAMPATLDQELESLAISKVDFIKLDVDGHEHEVLGGGIQTLKRFRPRILLELAPYVYSRQPDAFAEILRTLWAERYALQDVTSKQALPTDVQSVIAAIPNDGSINVLGVPQ